LRSHPDRDLVDPDIVYPARAADVSAEEPTLATGGRRHRDYVAESIFLDPRTMDYRGRTGPAGGQQGRGGKKKSACERLVTISPKATG
jgi:hypothetical protein